MIGRPRSSTLFPYPPLFRSQLAVDRQVVLPAGELGDGAVPRHDRETRHACHRERLDVIGAEKEDRVETFSVTCVPSRSEEHTSELQSRLHLVCRLLLEKKNM